MSALIATLLSLGVLFALVFIAIGVRGVMRKEQPAHKPWLFIGVGLVTLMNIWLYAGHPLG